MCSGDTGLQSQKEKHDYRSIEPRYLERLIFKYSQERYLNAIRFFKTHEEKMTVEILSIILKEASSTVKSKNVFFIPALSDTNKGELYSILAKSIGCTDMFLMEALKSKEDKLLKYGITVPHLYMMASGKEIPIQLRNEDTLKSRIRGVLASPAGKAGGEISRTKRTESDSEVKTDVKDVKYLLEYYLTLSELNKRGRIRNRKPILIKMTNTDVKLFGKVMIDEVAEYYNNIKIAFSTPKKEDATQQYEILSSDKVLSLFNISNDTSTIAQKIYEKITSQQFLSEMPPGLRELVTLMDQENYLYGAIKYITKSVANNPILAVKGTIYFIAKVYGYMNRRASKLKQEIEALEKSGEKDIAKRIMTGFKHMLYKNTEIAVAKVIGITSSKKFVPSFGYALTLKDFISELDDDKLERMYSTLKKEEEYPDALNVLVNIGAVKVLDEYMYKTRIGRVIEKMIERELIRRGKRIENIQERTEGKFEDIKIRLISEEEVESRLMRGT